MTDINIGIRYGIISDQMNPQLKTLVDEAYAKLTAMAISIKNGKTFVELEWTEITTQILTSLAQKAYQLGHPKPLQLEVGKYYRSRDGRKVDIFRVHNHPIFRFLGDDEKTYKKNGEYFNSNQHPRDLISEWQEEVNPEQPTLQPLPDCHPSSKYYPLWKYMRDEHGVTLLETDCQEIERLLPQQLQPLPEQMPEWFQSWFDDKSVAEAIYDDCKEEWGTPPREWWQDLKKGDKFVDENDKVRIYDGILFLSAEKQVICDAYKSKPVVKRYGIKDDLPF